MRKVELRGDQPCKKIYEDEFALAFPDIHPQAPIHLLVIPKARYVNLIDFGANAKAEEISGLLRAIVLTAKNLGLDERGYRVVANIGQHGHQEVPHLHFHILGGRQFSHQLASAALEAPENTGIMKSFPEN